MMTFQVNGAPYEVALTRFVDATCDDRWRPMLRACVSDLIHVVFEEPQQSIARRAPHLRTIMVERCCRSDGITDHGSQRLEHCIARILRFLEGQRQTAFLQGDCSETAVPPLTCG